jgi:dihydroorotate dehydrogenase electron transfer subunit
LSSDAASLRPIQATVCDVIFNLPVVGPYQHLAVAAPATALAATPGQFFQLLCPGQGQGSHVLRRPMSVYRIDRTHGRVEFLYKVVGTGTRRLAGLATGDALNLFGPLGHGFRLAPGWRHVILLGRGAGMATLAPLAETASASSMAVTAVLSVARPELAVSIDRLRAAGAEVILVNDVDGSAAPDRVERLLCRVVAERRSNLIATCGSNRLLQLVQRLGRELGIAGQVALEQPMACGIGMCFCCVRPFALEGQTEYRRVCHDGPVFDVQQALA